jgi:ubiquinone/menaquinone biosynthesis C-methylase UbiE
VIGRFRLKAREWLDVPERKRAYNERHFAEASSRYDLATRMMSLGRDAVWKRALVASLPDLPSPVCVDLACGTGDVAFLLAGRYPDGVVKGLDLSAPMLEIARERNRFTNVRFERGDLCDLPFPDGSADVVTGSSNPDRSSLRYPQYLLLRSWCGLWGLLLHGTPEIHGYVAESLRDFPGRNRLRGIFRENRFEVLAERRYFLGVTGSVILRPA